MRRRLTSSSAAGGLTAPDFALPATWLDVLPGESWDSSAPPRGNRRIATSFGEEPVPLMVAAPFLFSQSSCMLRRNT